MEPSLSVYRAWALNHHPGSSSLHRGREVAGQGSCFPSPSSALSEAGRKMRKETAADSAATMVVAVRVANPDRSAGWGQREMAQQLCELEAADRHHSCALHPLTHCGHRQALSSPLPSFQLQLCLSLPLHSHSLFSQTLSSMSFPATVHLGGSFRVLLQLCPQYYHTYLHSNNSHR